METLGFIFGLIGFTWCMSLKSKVDRLERMIKDNLMPNTEKASLKEIIEKNIGKIGKIKLEKDTTDYEVSEKECILQDVDEDWLLLEVKKSGVQKLVRLQSIKGIQFK